MSTPAPRRARTVERILHQLHPLPPRPSPTSSPSPAYSAALVPASLIVLCISRVSFLHPCLPASSPTRARTVRNPALVYRLRGFAPALASGLGARQTSRAREPNRRKCGLDLARAASASTGAFPPFPPRFASILLLSHLPVCIPYYYRNLKEWRGRGQARQSKSSGGFKNENTKKPVPRIRRKISSAFIFADVGFEACTTGQSENERNFSAGAGAGCLYLEGNRVERGDGVGSFWVEGGIFCCKFEICTPSK
ncbi:hypothetical protein B0H16DRAFT_1454215 [Mycena metata]|uniref:Uncharacterized protein n=1 Tax=Mycena metata TaxID=1033252 RepID=A0AAD7JIQ2_9AGAR|nr:hypothetical protein B0H16DRAFT_1454215 [Mycena metata]